MPLIIMIVRMLQRLGPGGGPEAVEGPGLQVCHEPQSYIYIYIYICIEREICMYVYIYMCIHVYIDIDR